VSADIQECELINRSPSGGGAHGPTGGALIVYTRNPNKGDAPPADEDAFVTARIGRSIVRVTAPNGHALYAMNFASRGRVSVELTNSVIGGALDIVGGLARPDKVVNAKTSISSRGNLYEQAGSWFPAWQIVGGGSAPPPINGAGASSNSADIDSTDDKIHEFQLGLVALGGRRFTAEAGPCSANEVELQLIDLTLSTEGPEAADFVLAGALSTGPFAAGDENTVKVLGQHSTGSGMRGNLYADSVGFGTGNQLIFRGSPAAFEQSNNAIDPPPPAELFER
jgi:hypothetical protein